MYKLHQTNVTIPVEMKKQSKGISVNPAVVERELGTFSDSLSERLVTEHEDRYMTANQFAGENMPRYLPSQDYCDRYSEISPTSDLTR